MTVSWVSVFTLLPSRADHPHLVFPHFLFTWKKFLHLPSYSVWRKTTKPTFSLLYYYHYLLWGSLLWRLQLWVWSLEEDSFFTPWCSKLSDWKYTWADSVVGRSVPALFLLIFPSSCPTAVPGFVTIWGWRKHRLWEEHENKSLSQLTMMKIASLWRRSHLGRLWSGGSIVIRTFLQIAHSFPAGH